MKHIIIFGPEGPDSSAEGVVTAKFAQMLVNHNIDVYWISHSTTVNYGNNGKLYDYKIISIKNTLIQNLIEKFKNIPGLNKIKYLDIIIWCIKAYKKALQINKSINIDCIFSRIMPQYGHLPALFFKRSTKVKWIANWSDPMPRNKAPMPYGNGVNAPISTIYRHYLKAICKYADIHTFPSNHLKDYYLHYLPATKNLCHVIPHIIDKNIARVNVEHQELRLYHIGGGLIQRNPTLFFRALRNVINDNNYDIPIDIQFIGPIEGNVKEIAKNEGVDKIIHFIDRVSYDKALEYIANADIMLIIEAQMDEGIFLPSKLADILGYHKPVFAISPKNGVLNELITNYHGGRVADCMSINSIQDNLIQIFCDWATDKLKNIIYNTTNLRSPFTEDNVWQVTQDIISND